MLTIKDLTYTINGRMILDKVSLQVAAGQHIGLVGKNGAGKSTLFNLIAGDLEADGGEISIAKGVRVGRVNQELPDDDTTLIDVVLAADIEAQELFLEAETASDPERIGYIYARLEEIGAYEAPARAASILSGLGFDHEAQQQPISSFSGGWRMRVALAAVLFLQPDLLMLDEPTNHLDFEAMIWLENYLARYDKTMIIISHDRDILNKTVSHIVHLENTQLQLYTGTYDQFERQRAERMLNQQAMHDKQMEQKARMMKFVERFRAKASKARQAQSRLKAIEKMDIVDAVIADRASAFYFNKPETLYSPLIALDNISAGYQENKPVLRNLNLRIDMDDRIALLGMNGNGKSTLVKLLAGKLQPQDGEMNMSNRIKIGYFAQHQNEELDVTSTPYELIQRTMPDEPEPKARGVLGRFGFDKNKADTKVSDLSGGERSRLLLALMSVENPHILLLDEPTNHLDIDARQALIQALNNYEGAVILVSHDPHLVECVADRLWLVQGGTCKHFDGDTADYKQLVLNNNSKNKKKDSKPAVENVRKQDKKPDKRKFEKQLEELYTAKSNLVEAMQKEKSYDQLASLQKQLDNLDKEIVAVEKSWLD